MEKRFITAKETGYYLNLSEDTVRKWAMRGKIPYFKFGKALRFDRIAIDKWAEKCKCSYYKT